MLIIPLNLDSVLLLLHNSKLAYSSSAYHPRPIPGHKHFFKTNGISRDGGAKIWGKSSAPVSYEENVKAKKGLYSQQYLFCYSVYMSVSPSIRRSEHIIV